MANEDGEIWVGAQEHPEGDAKPAEPAPAPKRKWGVVRLLLVGCGGLVLLAALMIGLVAFWVTRQQAHYDETAVPYLETTLREIAEWDADTVWSHYAPEVGESVTREDHERIVAAWALLGRLEELGEPTLQNYFAGTSIGGVSRTVLTYQVPGRFENGESAITVRLQDVDGELSILSLNFNSTVFLPSAATP